MSSTATSSDSSSESSVPLQPVGAEQNAVMQEISALHLKINSAIDRVAQLENAAGLGTKRLVAIDSPAMKFALELSATLFPGSTTQVETIFDPDNPSRSWYAVNIRWRGEIPDSLQRETAWHQQFDQSFGAVARDFAICVDLS